MEYIQQHWGIFIVFGAFLASGLGFYFNAGRDKKQGKR